jgi:hypothetical protein
MIYIQEVKAGEMIARYSERVSHDPSKFIQHSWNLPITSKTMRFLSRPCERQRRSHRPSLLRVSTPRVTSGGAAPRSSKPWQWLATRTGPTPSPRDCASRTASPHLSSPPISYPRSLPGSRPRSVPDKDLDFHQRSVLSPSHRLPNAGGRPRAAAPREAMGKTRPRAAAKSPDGFTRRHPQGGRAGGQPVRAGSHASVRADVPDFPNGQR